MRIKTIFISLVILMVNIMAVSAGDQPTEIPVISQRFEGGEMIYQEDNGDIYVLSNISAEWWLFTSEDYAELAENTDLDAPEERLAPENGFGQIWANHETIREELGWAVLPEIGFDMSIRTTDTGNFYFTRLNGIQLHLRPGGTWRVLSSESDHEAVINDFTVTPDNLASGETLIISYDTSGSDDVQITILSVENPDYRTDAYIELEESSDTLEWVIPETIEGDIEVTLNLINQEPSNGNGCCRETVASESIVVNISMDVDFRNETPAAYQAYENGFMIWREDTGGVHIFYNETNTWQVIQEHVYVSNSGYVETAPEGCVVPVNAFGKIWHSYFDVQVELGCAIDEEIAYTLTIEGDGTGQFEYSLPGDETITVTSDNWQ